MTRKFYIAGKSKDTWSQLPLIDQLVIKVQLANRDGLSCSKKNGHGCGKKFQVRELTIDHVIPISMGGPVSDIGNMQLLCRKCHSRKTSGEKRHG